MTTISRSSAIATAVSPLYLLLLELDWNEFDVTFMKREERGLCARSVIAPRKKCLDEARTIGVAFDSFGREANK